MRDRVNLSVPHETDNIETKLSVEINTISKYVRVSVSFH